MVDCGMLARSPEVHAMSAVYPHRPLCPPEEQMQYSPDNQTRSHPPDERVAEKRADLLSERVASLVSNPDRVYLDSKADETPAGPEYAEAHRWHRSRLH